MADILRTKLRRQSPSVRVSNDDFGGADHMETDMLFKYRDHADNRVTGSGQFLVPQHQEHFLQRAHSTYALLSAFGRETANLPVAMSRQRILGFLR